VQNSRLVCPPERRDGCCQRTNAPRASMAAMNQTPSQTGNTVQHDSSGALFQISHWTIPVSFNGLLGRRPGRTYRALALLEGFSQKFFNRQHSVHFNYSGHSFFRDSPGHSQRHQHLDGIPFCFCFLTRLSSRRGANTNRSGNCFPIPGGATPLENFVNSAYKINTSTYQRKE